MDCQSHDAPYNADINSHTEYLAHSKRYQRL